MSSRQFLKFATFHFIAFSEHVKMNEESPAPDTIDRTYAHQTGAGILCPSPLARRHSGAPCYEYAPGPLAHCRNLCRALGKHAVLISNENDNERRIYRAVDARIIEAYHDSVYSASRFGVPFRPGLRVWTDEYNNLFQITK
jgi:hypothetical protein